MRQIGFAIIIALTLVACSSQEDREAKKQPVSIDKAQIDIAQSDNYFQSTQRTNWHCILLAKTEANEEESARSSRLKAMTGRTVKITDRGEILGTGQIVGLIESQGRHVGVSIGFQSPEAAEELYKKLGFRERK